MTHRYPFSIIHPVAYYGQHVAVYFNLHYHVFSLKSGGKSGLLLTHAGVCILADAVFEVEPKGRERAIRQGRKNVHAYVVGILKLLSWDQLSDDAVRSLIESGYQRVTYNLHPDHPQFYCKDVMTYTPVTAAKAVILNDKIALTLVE
ncbi:hypothetical protein H6G80_32850 [Nostoc sp. FACHB-87]|uniref:hypothetical protein n=1 Tax=Nostocaceae TaxID=1162 RepID=UPI001689CF8D|nr:MULTISPECIES: hypothetical protein [Nostocaceae]MBD2458834.1 hypothetical protein [Nostoc sp. FACHB-87]MBD2479861.1 hypothetical protein [Anabaena sp. FACHB-83]